jgi:3-phosphoshikimate 1-carboxyvinyltransferase
VTEIEGLLEGDDVKRTAAAMAAFGAASSGWARAMARGRPRRLFRPADVVDLRQRRHRGAADHGGRRRASNLGRHAFTGDASLRGRPMNRVLKPLGEMGASWVCRAGGRSCR